jgi:CheY-like chemotaxis protein
MPSWPYADVEPFAGSGTVLIVEDDTSVRRLVCDVLAGKGYDVLEAPNGEEALEICGQHPGPIDLLLTDLIMPRMSGIELTSRVAAIRPEARPLVMTGYSGSAPLGEIASDFRAAYLENRSRPTSLRGRCARCLGTEDPPAAQTPPHLNDVICGTADRPGPNSG